MPGDDIFRTDRYILSERLRDLTNRLDREERLRAQVTNNRVTESRHGTAEPLSVQTNTDNLASRLVIERSRRHMSNNRITESYHNTTEPLDEQVNLEPLNEQTERLFKAIEERNLEDFEQALREGASVNALYSGYTPLMIIIVVYLTSDNDPVTEKKYHSMIKLLLLHEGIDINIRGGPELKTALHQAMLCFQTKVVQLLLRHPGITNIEQIPERNRASFLTPEVNKAEQGKELLNALSIGNIDEAQTLLNQELNPNRWKRGQNGEIETPLSLILKLCLQEITEDKQEILTKLLEHKDLDFSQIKPIPAIDNNRVLKEIIDQVLKERLITAINSNDLDNVKELVEGNCLMNDAIVIYSLNNSNNSINESIRSYLNETFAAHGIAAENSNVENEVYATNSLTDNDLAMELQRHENTEDDFEKEKIVEKIKKQSELKTKLIPQLRQIEIEFTRTQAQLEEKERELETIKRKLDEKTGEISDKDNQISAQQGEIIELRSRVAELTEENDKLKLLKTGSNNTNLTDQAIQVNEENNELLSNIRVKFLEASAQGKKYGNFASASFLTSAAFAVGTCFAMTNLVVCISLAAVALISLAVGCYCSYKANTALEGVTNEQFITKDAPCIGSQG